MRACVCACVWRRGNKVNRSSEILGEVGERKVEGEEESGGAGRGEEKEAVLCDCNGIGRPAGSGAAHNNLRNSHKLLWNSAKAIKLHTKYAAITM